MKPKLIIRMLALLIFIGTVFFITGCSSEQYLVLDPKGPIGESQKDLIIISTLLCAVIIVPVLIMTAIIVWRYRDHKGSKAAYKPEWEHNTKLEITWWSIPIVIILILAVITARYTYALEPSKPIVSEEKAITIQVTSMDWKWMFNYPEQGIATVNYIQIPKGVPVRFELTSDTAMNSFWVPQLGGQIYTMSGMAMTLYLQADEVGKYFGSGANFNGRDFAQMTFEVNATTTDDFNTWVNQVKKDYPPLTTEGFEKLREPGPSDHKFYSSFPEGLFDKIMRQYSVDGQSHHGHGAPDAKKSESNESKKSTATPAPKKSDTQSHTGH
ncbi:Quinol oxidase subunit 2 precursor [compost metagenome]